MSQARRYGSKIIKKPRRKYDYKNKKNIENALKDNSNKINNIEVRIAENNIDKIQSEGKNKKPWKDKLGKPDKLRNGFI